MLGWLANIYIYFYRGNINISVDWLFIDFKWYLEIDLRLEFEEKVIGICWVFVFLLYYCGNLSSTICLLWSRRHCAGCCIVSWIISVIIRTLNALIIESKCCKVNRAEVAELLVCFVYSSWECDQPTITTTIIIVTHIIHLLDFVAFLVFHRFAIQEVHFWW